MNAQLSSAPRAVAMAVTPMLKAYVINLDRAGDRLAAMTSQLNTLGLPWSRVPALDGNSFGALPWAGFDQRAYDSNWGKSPHPGEVGCYLSHVRALETFLAEGHEYGLILEDDGVFDADLAAVLNDVIACSSDWDVVKLAGIHSGMPAVVERLPHGRNLVAYLQRQTGAAAYLVTRRAAQTYVDKLLPMNVPFDHMFDQVWRYGLTLRGVKPLPVRDGSRPSTIGYGQRPGTKKVWYRRGSVLLYRARTEFRRLAHYFFTDTRWFTRLFASKAH